MAKALRTVAVIVGTVAAVASVVATGGATLGLSAALISTAGTVASIGGAVAGIASLAGSLTAKRPQTQGSATSHIFDPNGPVPYVMGRAFVAGSAIHRDTWGKDNEFQGFVTILSAGGPIESLDQFLSDQSPVSFSGTAAVGRFNDWMFMRTQLGHQPSPAFTFGSFPGLDSTFRLSGYAADIWTLRFDQKGERFAGGVPRRGWVGRFVKCYDPRLDSTYPGGAGSHRIDDESTWTFTQNPWLNELAWEIGRRSNGLLTVGVGIPFDQIDLPSYVFAANVADVNGWTVSGAVYSNEDKWAVSKTIALAGGGEPIKIGGKISAFVNSPKVSSETVQSSDIVGPCSVPSGPAFQDRINRIIPQYISEAHGWEMIPAAPVGVDLWREQDGGEWRTEDQPFRLVNQVDQAAQLGLYVVADSRERNGIVLALKPRWRGYGPGSCLTLNIPEYGLDNVKAIVIDRQEDASSKFVILTFRSENDAKHPLALAGTGTPPPGVDLIPIDQNIVPAPIIDAWTASSSNISQADANIAALTITGLVDNPNASQVVFEYQPNGSTEWIHAGTEDAKIVKKEITSVTDQTDYFVAISYVVRGVTSPRRIIGPLTTGSSSINFDNVFGASKPENGATVGATSDQIMNIEAAAGTAQWGGVVSRPIELTDGRVSSGLTSVGDVARNVPQNRAGHIVAAAIAGQGDLATQNEISLDLTLGQTWKRTAYGDNHLITGSRVDAISSIGNWINRTVGESFRDSAYTQFRLSANGNRGLAGLCFDPERTTSNGFFNAVFFTNTSIGNGNIQYYNSAGTLIFNQAFGGITENDLFSFFFKDSVVRVYINNILRATISINEPLCAPVFGSLHVGAAAFDMRCGSYDASIEANVRGMTIDGLIAQNVPQNRAGHIVASGFTGQGSLATQNGIDAASSFLFGLLPESKAATALRNSALVPSITSAAGTAQWGGVVSRPVELTDGRVSSGLTSVGDVARNVPQARGGHIVAAAVAGQGDLATQNEISLDLTLGQTWKRQVYGPAHLIAGSSISALVNSNWDNRTVGEVYRNSAYMQFRVLKSNSRCFVGFCSNPSLSSGTSFLNACFFSNINENLMFASNYISDTTPRDLSTANYQNSDIFSLFWSGGTIRMYRNNQLIRTVIYTGDLVAPVFGSLHAGAAAFDMRCGSYDASVEANVLGITKDGDVARNVPQNRAGHIVAAAYAGQTAWGTYTGSINRISKFGDDGRVNDPRAYNTQALLGPRSTTNLVPTYTVGASNVTINLPAHTRLIAGMSGPQTLSYGASSGVQPFSKLWYAYIDDPNLTGNASPSVIFTNNAQDLLFTNRYHIASGFTPAANNTGGTTGSGGGGSHSGITIPDESNGQFPIR